MEEEEKQNIQYLESSQPVDCVTVTSTRQYLPNGTLLHELLGRLAELLTWFGETAIELTGEHCLLCAVCFLVNICLE